MKQFLKKWYWLIAPILLAILVHLPSLSCGFVWDDISLVQKHPSLSEPDFAKAVFFRDYGLEFGSRQPIGYYRPMLMVINIAVHARFGNSAIAYHLFSMTVFCIAVLLLALAVHEISPRNKELVACIASCLYASHPARTEVVSLFMSLPDLLVEISALGTVLLLVRPLKRSSVTLAFSALLCTAATLSKEVAMLTLPAIAITAFVHAILKRKDWRNPAALLAGTILGCSITIFLTVSAGIEHHPASAYLKAIFSNGSGRALASLLTAIFNILIPGPAVFMSRSPLSANTLTEIALAIVVLCGIALFIILLNKQSMMPALLLAWFGSRIISLFTLRAVHVPYSERYLPVAAATIALCLMVYHLLRRIDFSRSRALRVRAAMLIAVYIGMNAAFTLGSSIKCVSPIAFFTFMAEEHPRLAYPRVHLANILATCNESLSKAENYAFEARDLDPDDPMVRNLGKLCALLKLRRGDNEGAIRDLKWAGEVIKNDPQIEHLLALSYYHLERYNDAYTHISRALERNATNEMFIALSHDIMSAIQSANETTDH